MLEHGLIAWVIPAICALFSFAFFAIGRRHREARGSYWAMSAFLIAATGMIIDLHRDHMPPVLVAIAVPFHWLAVGSLLQAFLARHGKSLLKWPITTLMGIAIGFHCYYYLFDYDLLARVLISAVIGTAICLQAGSQLYTKIDRAIDRVILGLVIGVGATYTIRLIPFLMQNGQATSADEWLSSPYIAVFYITSAIYAVMSGLALLLAMGIDLVEQHYLESRVDHLTGVPNRRALNQWIDEENVDSPDYGAVLMVDLDHFKSINDRFGHEIGDQVLVSVAQALESKLGAFARIARIGGEEFAVFIDAEHCEAAQALSLVARKTVAAIRFASPLEELHVTASIGLALRQKGDSLRDSMRCADMALYEAKASGRNKAVTHRARRRRATDLKAVV
jgi:diguanylate cyclase (GGDEF)-like protein